MPFGDRYLTRPDRAPREPGVLWGEEELLLALPGGPYRLLGLAAAQRAELERSFAARGVRPESGGKAAVEIRLCRLAPGELRTPERPGWHYAPDLLHRPETVSIAGLDLFGRIDRGPASRGSLWTPAAAGPALTGAVFNFLRLLVAHRLLEQGGALVHSASLVAGTDAYLFFGRSGAGKSTLAEIGLAGGLAVPSDDVNAVTPGVEAPRVEGLPLTVRLHPAGARDSYPLRGLLRLRHGERVHVAALGTGEALAALLIAAPYVNHDPHASRRLEDNLLSLLSAVPTGTLTFARTSTAADVLASLRRPWSTSAPSSATAPTSATA